MPTLRRVSDGAGDSGSYVQAIKWNKDGTFKKVIDSFPTIGCSLLVGSQIARTMQNQDYWLTTCISSFEEYRDGYVRFKTENSEYEFTYHPDELKEDAKKKIERRMKKYFKNKI